MMFAFLITFIFALVVWLVFFKSKWLIISSRRRGEFSSFFCRPFISHLHRRSALHHPYSTNLKVVQPTIQLVPRLPEPTLVTSVLVEPSRYLSC
jgi:hypothetical protein